MVRPYILELIPRTAQHILDVGCAAGTLGRAIKERQNCKVAGVEIVPEQAEKAREVLDTVFVGDVAKLALTLLENYYDCIILADVLEHLPDPKSVLKMLQLSLIASGVMVISIPNIRYWPVVRGLIEGHWDYVEAGHLDNTHLRFFTRESFERLLCEVGLRPVRRGTTHIQGDAAIPQAIIAALAAAGLNVETLREEAQVYQYLYVVQQT